MRVLFVHEVNYLEKVVFEMHEFPEYLSQRGHLVGFVDFQEARSFGRNFRVKHEVISGRVKHQEQIDLYHLPRLGTHPFDRLFAAVRSRQSIKKVMLLFRPDVVVLYGVATNGPATIKAAKALGIPVIYRAIDVSAELRRTIFSTLIEMAECYVSRHADICLANNAVLAARLVELGASANNVHTLVPGFEVANISLEDSTEQDDCDHDLVFMGTLFRFSGLDWLLDLLASSPGLQGKSLLIIGDGESMLSLKRQVERLDLTDRVTFTGFVPFSELAKQVRRGRIAVLPFAETAVARFALPGKVFQYLSFGKATVSTRLDGLQSVFPEGFGVFYAEPGEAFGRCIELGLRNFETIDADLARGQQLLRERYNWHRVIQEFEIIIDGLVRSDRR